MTGMEKRTTDFVGDTPNGGARLNSENFRRSAFRR